MENYFAELNRIDVGDKIEKKNGLSYLSWAWAWRELKKKHPDATYTVYENKDGWNYHTDGKTCWVKTGVTVNGIEHIEYLPVMNYSNKSLKLAEVTSFDVNKAIQRSLTKAVARHGLGLYIYAGEDLPESSDGEQEQADKSAQNNKISQEKRKALFKYAKDKFGDDANNMVTYEMKLYGYESTQDITESDYEKIMNDLEQTEPSPLSA